MGNMLNLPMEQEAPELMVETYDRTWNPRVLNQEPDTDTGGSELFTAHHIVLPPWSASVREHMNSWPIFDQGGIGSCTANAIAGAIEFELKTKGDESHQHAPSRLFICYNERANIDVDGYSGVQIKDVLFALQKTGVLSEASWPYVTKRLHLEPPESCYKSAVHVTSEFRLFPQCLLEMKKAIASGYPVVFGIQVYSSFFEFKHQNSGNIPLPDTSSETLYGGHAILAVAYDDTSERVTFRNSWGAEWGDCGCGTLPYQYFDQEHCLANSMWVIKKTDQF